MVLADIGGNGGKTPTQATSGTQALRVNQVLELARPMGLSGVQTARLRNMVAAYLAGERELQETREMVERPESQAGIGMASDDAAWFMDAMQAVRFNRPIPERRKGRLPVAGEGQAAPATNTAPVVAPPASPIKPKRVAPAPTTDFSGMKRQDVFATLAKDMVDDLKPVLASTDLRPRLEALVVTRLRDVRDKTELLVHLVRPVAEGGIGLPKDEASRLADGIEAQTSKLQAELAAVKKQDIVTSLNKTERKEEARREQSGALADFAQSKWLEGKLSGRAAADQPPAPSAVTAPVAPRGLMQDVVPKPTKLLGPIEELAAMTLVDFRRLAKTPDESTKRILEKVKLLEEEDYRQRALAISAWQQSEPFRLYVALTGRMLEEGVTAEAILAADNPQKTPRLTIEEYNAIMRLQESLRV